MEPISINRHMYDRGRGPELRRCRITVYDLFPYLETGWTDAQILTDVYRIITAEELVALKEYIAEHREEVESTSRKMDERFERERAAQAVEFQMKFGNTAGRVQYFKTWLADREQEARKGGTPLPKEPHEKLRAYLDWWHVHRSGLNGVHS